MANVVPSELAPDEAQTYSLGNVTFELATGDSYETDDREVIANAVVHPWLNVEYAEGEEPVSRFRPGTVAPEDDALGTAQSIAFDPEAVEAAAAEAEAAVANPVAIEAGLDQGEPVEKGGIAFTHAADDAPEESDEPAPARYTPPADSNDDEVIQ
jgi:hypothetical protein